MQPEPPRNPFVPPIVLPPPALAVCLSDHNAIGVVCQLGRVVRSLDRSLPDVERDRQVIFLPDFGRQVPAQVRDLPRLYLFERRDVRANPLYHALTQDGRGAQVPVLTTTKASFFNYLHPRVIEEHLGVTIEVTDHSDVVLDVAQALLPRTSGKAWHDLDTGNQRSRCEDAARLLAARAAPAMTPQLLSKRKGKADVARWLYLIKLALPRQFYD